ASRRRTSQSLSRQSFKSKDGIPRSQRRVSTHVNIDKSPKEVTGAHQKSDLARPGDQK
ncbi:hypothetical protein CCACVL1_00048, partial [Corchorus capsularis]